MSVTEEQLVVLLGTSRSDGNTRSAVLGALAGVNFTIKDLADENISAFDYGHRNRQDSFLPLIETISPSPLWILATPVYWYTMSSQLKMFMDRLSDLITIRKDLGRKLCGKSLAVIASGTDELLPDGFEAPFRLTAEYFGMNYAGIYYQQFGKNRKSMRCSATEKWKAIVGTRLSIQ